MKNKIKEILCNLGLHDLRSVVLFNRPNDEYHVKRKREQVLSGEYDYRECVDCNKKFYDNNND